MKLVTGVNIPSGDVITVARLASASGLNILMKLQSPHVKLKVITSFAGIMFILEDVKDSHVLSFLVYAAENGKTQVINASALGHKKWRITVVDALGIQSEEILKLPLRFFISGSNFKFLSHFPKFIFREVEILRIEGGMYGTS